MKTSQCFFPIALLLSLAALSPAFGELHAIVQVDPSEDNSTDGTFVNLGWIDKAEQNKISDSASINLSPHQSTLKATATVSCLPLARTLKVALTHFGNFTSGASEPPSQAKRSTVHTLFALAEFRDTLRITSAVPQDNVEILIFFDAKSSILLTPTPDSDGEDSQLRAGAVVTENSNSEASVTVASHNGEGDLEAIDKSLLISIKLPHLDQTGVFVRIGVSASIWTSGSKYFSATAGNGQDELSVEYSRTELFGAGLSGVTVVGSSGFRYLEGGSTPLKSASGKYAGAVASTGAGAAAQPVGKGKVTVNKAGDAATVDLGLSIAGTKIAAKGHLTAFGPVKFGTSDSLTHRTRRRNLPDLITSAELRKTGNAFTIEGTVTEDGTGQAWTFLLQHAIYTRAKNPVAPFLNVPADLLGNYTVLLEAEAGAEAAGAGWGTVKLDAGGIVTLTGKLSDGTSYRALGPLLEGGEWPFFIPLYAGKGSFSGTLRFRETAGVSDLDALGSRWVRPPLLKKPYPNGWPGGIDIDLIGSHFVVPPRTPAQSILPGLGPVDATNGNADFIASAGGLLDTDPLDADPATPLSKSLNIAPTNRVTIPVPNPAKFAATLGATGKWAGSFLHNATGKRTTCSGVVFQKQEQAAGYFLTPTAIGRVEMSPR